MGFEPMTFALRAQRSTDWANDAHDLLYHKVVCLSHIDVVMREIDSAMVRLLWILFVSLCRMLWLYVSKEEEFTFTSHSGNDGLMMC